MAARGKQNNALPLMTAVIYARFSSHNQREESIEQQVAECKLFAQQNGLEIIEVYSDSAITGKTEKRTQFQRLQRDAKKGKFSYLIAYKSNRIARNMLLALKFEDEMEKLGVKVLYAKEEFGNNAAGRFALRTMMNVNQFYSENMAEDIRRGMEDNALKCKVNGPCPFGYQAGDDGKFQINEDEAVIVQEIFSKVACGEPFVNIAASINQRGIKTSKGGEWGRNSFHRLLKNEKYIGVYEFGNIRVEDGIPPIISKELFYKVQRKLTEKKNPQGKHRENGDYLLTGKLYCGECGSHMVGLSGTAKSGSLHYYYGCNKKRLEKNCSKKNVRREYIETEVAKAIKTYILQDEVVEWIADMVDKYQKQNKHNSELALLETQLSDINKSIGNLLTAIEQGIITNSTKQRLMELEDEQSKLNSQITLIKADTIEVSKDHVIAWLEAFRNGDIEDKKYQAELFKSFLKSVYLYDDGNCKIVFDLFGRDDGEVNINIQSIEDKYSKGAESVRITSPTLHQY